MAIFKHRDIEAVMPPEVRRRAHRGVGKGRVDWYAGRRYQSNLSADAAPQRGPADLTDEMRDARRQIRRQSTTERRDRASNAVRALASRPRRILMLVMHRLQRRFGGAPTHQI